MTISIDASGMRESFSETLSRVCYTNERVTIKRHGKPVAALVSLRDLKLLEALEDAADVKAARKALADPERIPWEQVKADLGLATKRPAKATGKKTARKTQQKAAVGRRRKP